MKKIISLFLLTVSALLILVSCSGKSVKQVVSSYVNATSYKEKAFVEAVFPKDEKIDDEEIVKTLGDFELEYGLIKSYFKDREFTDDAGKSYAAYFKDTYDPLLSAYVTEAKSFADKIKSGEDVVPYLDALWDYDGKFVDVHNGFLDLLEK